MNTVFVWLLQWILPRRFWYREFYLRSRHWRIVRRAKLEKVHYACEKCHTRMYNPVAKVTLDVHHKTYAHMFRELLSDLQVLCRTCHQLEHQKG